MLAEMCYTKKSFMPGAVFLTALFLPPAKVSASPFPLWTVKTLNNIRRAAVIAQKGKAYAGSVPEAMVKADAESLIAFCRRVDNTIPVFCFENAPSKFSQYYLSQRGIKCIVGTPEEIAVKLDIISSL